MYTTPFSQQWIFDRCTEASALFPGLVFLVSLLIGIFLYFLLRKKLKNILAVAGISFAGFILSLFVVGVSGIFVGFGLLSCSDSMLWTSVEAAHHIHALMKLQYEKSGEYPHNYQEVMQLDPQAMQVIATNAKTQYVYNPATNTYTWFVRPSKYYVAIFDTKNDFALYTVPSLIRVDAWGNMQSFPPLYAGPWEKLPN